MKNAKVTAVLNRFTFRADGDEEEFTTFNPPLDFALIFILYVNKQFT